MDDAYVIQDTIIDDKNVSRQRKSSSSSTAALNATTTEGTHHPSPKISSAHRVNPTKDTTDLPKSPSLSDLLLTTKLTRTISIPAASLTSASQQQQGRTTRSLTDRLLPCSTETPPLPAPQHMPQVWHLVLNHGPLARLAAIAQAGTIPGLYHHYITTSIPPTCTECTDSKGIQRAHTRTTHTKYNEKDVTSSDTADLLCQRQQCHIDMY